MNVIVNKSINNNHIKEEVEKSKKEFNQEYIGDKNNNNQNKRGETNLLYAVSRTENEDIVNHNLNNVNENNDFNSV